MEIEIQNIIKIVEDAAGILSQRDLIGDISVKGPADFVTEADKDIQQFIQAELLVQYPDIQFLGEEDSQKEVDFYGKMWVLDPVDGTTNLIHDYRSSAISLALFEAGKPVLGIIYQPYTKELFWAQKGKGAFLGTERISVSEAGSLSESIVNVGTSPYKKELADENFELIKKVFCKSQDIRRSGSAALDLAWIACGRSDAFFERNLKLWDFAAGWIIIEEAGGKIADFNGMEISPVIAADIVTGTPKVCEELWTLIKENCTQISIPPRQVCGALSGG